MDRGLPARSLAMRAGSPRSVMPPLVMGILNVTPDSFSDGGRFTMLDDAVARAARMIADGADILDIGGESTRPGATPVGEVEELSRVIPVIEALAARGGVPLSIDTRRSRVARAAMAAGAQMWNDVSALGGDTGSLAAAAELGCRVVLMHMRGEPATMQRDPHYEDVVAEVTSWLAERARVAMSAGVERERIWLDPGIGFGKTLAHNLALLAALDRLVELGFPVLLGASRKGMIRKVDRTAEDPLDRLGGSLAIALAGARARCAMVRVHDVRETAQALKVMAAIDSARDGA
ncbi:MAG: dihydropteroate synthase [Caulobacteraceae bacterium]|nr:dihydropteroate synthase [Caulobacteraceae bacterium]